MYLPVDGILVEGSGVESDEASMTGESDTVLKETFEKCMLRKSEHEEDNKSGHNGAHDVPSPILLSGTNIQKGEGYFVVVVVGDETCEGKIMSAVNKKG